MQAYECTAEVDDTGALHLPEEIAVRVISHKLVRVLVLLDEQPHYSKKEERIWNTVTRDEFVQGYSPNDALYDAL